MPRKIIIDTDPGVDDAMAIFTALASPELDVLGLTTIYGNAAVDVTSQNALLLLEVAERVDIPVAQGASIPLTSPYRGPVDFVHGENGLGNAVFDAPTQSLHSQNAMDFLHTTIFNNPHQVTFLTLGPLTNLALTVQQYPGIVPLIDEIVIMGGNALEPGNASPAAEANILHDPEAADIVFGQNWKVTMVGLDVTHRVNITGSQLKKIASGSSPRHRLLADAIPFYQRFHESVTEGLDGIHVHDPTAVTYLIHPELFQKTQGPIRVETQGFSRGKTWVASPDHLAFAPEWKNRPDINVCIGVNGKAVAAFVTERLAR